MSGLQTEENARQPKSSRALRTISEAADLLDVPQHVLRFWETKFAQIKPLKRNGGRRFYRPEDIDTLLKVKFLLYRQGYTIKGAQKVFDDKQADQVFARLMQHQERLASGTSPLANDNAQAATPEPMQAARDLAQAVQYASGRENAKDLTDIIANLKDLSSQLKRK